MSTAATEVIELVAEFGLLLDPWECHVLSAALGEREDGTWAAFEVGCCCPRQNGKTEILQARMLAGLFLFGEELIVYSAHEFKTAREAMRRLEARLQDSGERYKPNHSHVDEGVELPTGARVMFQTRTKAAGRGLSADCVIFDEAMILESAAVQAVMPTLSARPNPQLWYMGSAVFQPVHQHGLTFAGVRRRGLAGDSPQLCWMEWSAPDDADPTDLEARAQANPGMGYRISAEYIENEWQAFKATNPDGWMAERLGIGDWPGLDGETAPVFDLLRWTGLCNRDAPEPGEAVLAVAVAQDRSWSCLVVAGAGSPGKTVVLCRSGRGVAWVAKTVAGMIEARPIISVVLVGEQAKTIKPDLVQAGVEFSVLARGEQGASCAAFQEAVKAGTVEHVGQGELDRAVENARVKLSGESEHWDRRDAWLDDSPLVAAAAGFYVWGLQEAPAPAVY